MKQCQTFAFLDLETTGLSGVGEKPRITELSLVAVHRTMLKRSRHLPRVMDKLTVCVYPMQSVTPTATDLTGLSNDNLYSHKDFDSQLVSLLSGFIDRLDPPVCLIAHNGNRFDFGLLQVELQTIAQSLPHGLMCADSLQMFQHLDLAEALMVATPQGGYPQFCTPKKQVTSTDKLSETGSSSLRKRKPESVARRISPETAKKRLFDACDCKENGVGVLEPQDVVVVDGCKQEKGPNADNKNLENTADNSSNDSWNLDVTDSELLASDITDTPIENGVSSDTLLQKDTQNAGSGPVGVTACTTTGPSIAESIQHNKLANSVDILQAVLDVEAPCDTTNGAGASTPKAKLMSTSILLNTPPYSPAYASKMAIRNTSGSSSKKKQSYTLKELHKRVVGYYPQDSHQAEGDSLALVRIFQNSDPQACEWADHHAVPFSSIPLLYRTKARYSLPSGVFPYQI